MPMPTRMKLASYTMKLANQAEPIKRLLSEIITGNQDLIISNRGGFNTALSAFLPETRDVLSDESKLNERQKFIVFATDECCKKLNLSTVLKLKPINTEDPWSVDLGNEDEVLSRPDVDLYNAPFFIIQTPTEVFPPREVPKDFILIEISENWKIKVQMNRWKQELVSVEQGPLAQDNFSSDSDRENEPKMTDEVEDSGFPQTTIMSTSLSQPSFMVSTSRGFEDTFNNTNLDATVVNRLPAGGSQTPVIIATMAQVPRGTLPIPTMYQPSPIRSDLLRHIQTPSGINQSIYTTPYVGLRDVRQPGFVRPRVEPPEVQFSSVTRVENPVSNQTATNTTSCWNQGCQTSAPVLEQRSDMGADRNNRSGTNTNRVASGFPREKVNVLNASTVSGTGDKKPKIRLQSQVALPDFDPTDPDAEIVESTILNLKLLAEIGFSTDELIFGFLSKNKLTSLLLSLTPQERSDLDVFGAALKRRYQPTQAAVTAKFNQIRQLPKEDELELFNRILRTYNLMRGFPVDHPLQPQDTSVVSERFVSALRDSKIRLQIRQFQVPIDNLVETARSLRHATESEEQASANLSIDEQIVALTNRLDLVDPARVGPNASAPVCPRCLSYHYEGECRVNRKNLAKANKVKKGEAKPQKNLAFDMTTNQQLYPNNDNDKSDSQNKGENSGDKIGEKNENQGHAQKDNRTENRPPFYAQYQPPFIPPYGYRQNRYPYPQPRNRWPYPSGYFSSVAPPYDECPEPDAEYANYSFDAMLAHNNQYPF